VRAFPATGHDPPIAREAPKSVFDAPKSVFDASNPVSGAPNPAWRPRQAWSAPVRAGPPAPSSPLPTITLPDHAGGPAPAMNDPTRGPDRGPDRPTVTLAHSPDPDDAFMWWPLLEDAGGPAVDTAGFRFELRAADIEELNEQAEAGVHDVTALSCAQYPRVAATYAITSCGASIGDGYGPKLVARRAMDAGTLRASNPRIAIPGTRTTAAAVLGLLMDGAPFEPVPMPFDEMLDRIAGGETDAGVVIHEGQLTFTEHGLHLVADLGRWWRDRTGGPLPLGLNVIRRSLDDVHGPGTLRRLTGVLLASVEHALAHRERSVEYALGFARGLDAERADRFIEMYVNAWTLDFGPDGRAAVARLLGDAAAAGLLPATGEPTFVEPLDTART